MLHRGSRYAVGYAAPDGVQLTWRSGGLGIAYVYMRFKKTYDSAVPPRCVYVVSVKTRQVVKRFYTMEGAETWLQNKHDSG